jgi:hypothetical protein
MLSDRNNGGRLHTGFMQGHRPPMFPPLFRGGFPASNIGSDAAANAGTGRGGGTIMQGDAFVSTSYPTQRDKQAITSEGHPVWKSCSQGDHNLQPDSSRAAPRFSDPGAQIQQARGTGVLKSRRTRCRDAELGSRGQSRTSTRRLRGT